MRISFHYILKDHLGSWTTITDEDGRLEQELSFDAWGNQRDPETWTGSSTAKPMFDRGYTGHEHMSAFGLINMNGRCYDPVMSSFLSVDAFVQSPESAQGFNRYSYCQNNPLRYTDPSGWQMIGGNKPRNPFHDDWSVSHVQHAYTPRDFGLMQLSDADPIVAWMAENEMQGGARLGDGIITQGGWYRDANGKIKYDKSITKETVKKGQTFLGITYVESNMYYSLTGQKLSLDSFDGKVAQVIEKMILNNVQYNQEIRNYTYSLYGSSESIEKSVDLSGITNFVRDAFGYSATDNNRIEFSYEGALGYFYQFDPKAAINENGILAKFGWWPQTITHLQNYGLYGTIPDGYHIYFPKTNTLHNGIYSIILVYPNTTSGRQNYELYKSKINSVFPNYRP